MTATSTIILQVQNLVKHFPILGEVSLPGLLVRCGPWTV